MHIIKKTIYFLVTLAIIIKVVFLLAAILYYINQTLKINMDDKLLLNVMKIKDNSEFIYQITIALLIIIIFNPWYNNMRFISKEIMILFFIFGIIIIISADWNHFFLKDLKKN
jgi:hypothetical protein